MRDNTELMPKRFLWIIFFTGFSTLVYEICWVRQATLIFGVSVYAYSAVLTAYMGGMAIGNLLFGKKADRTTYLYRLFAYLQIGLALSGILAVFLLSGFRGTYAYLVQILQPNHSTITIIRLSLALIAMILPAICIGGMVPVMARINAMRDGQVGYDVGNVYVINTLGSVVGCGITAILLIRWMGLRETVFLAAGLNLVLAYVISRTMAIQVPIKIRSKQQTHMQKDKGRKQIPNFARFLLIAYGISGFAALGYEIVWARIISLHTIGAIYSFSIMLTVFLSGLTLGGLIGTRWVHRRNVGFTQFGFLEIGIGLLALLVLPIFFQINRLSIESIFGSYSITGQILFEGLLSIITLFPVTVLIGMAFPFVSSIYTMERAEKVGAEIGSVISINTIGSIVGSLLTGFLIVPALGLQRSTFLLATLNVFVGVMAIWIYTKSRERTRLVGFSILAGIILLGIFLPPRKYLGYWESVRERLLFYEEGVETTVAVYDAGPNNPKFSTVNGRIEVPTDVLSMRAFYLLGHLPALLQPNAQNALMLSFGNGISTGALATHSISNIDVVELAPEMINAAEVYSVENRNVLNINRLDVHIEDARNYLMQTKQTFDIITTDATHPANSASWILFTAEFYRDVKDHLADDGVFLQWVPIHSLSIHDYLSIIKTFQYTFPTATLWYTGGSHTLLLATSEYITSDLLGNRLSSIENESYVVEDLGTADKITRHWIMDSDQLSEFCENGEIIYDNDAFFMPDNSEMSKLIQIIQLAAIRANQ